MAMVADIEPASLTITPGTAERFTLTIRNEGEDAETYLLSAVGDAAEHVDIEPDSLLVQPGETATATATLHLEATGDPTAGELAVRFQVVSTDRPDDVLVLGAIARIQSSGGVGGDVDAVLSPPTIEGRRSAATLIEVANTGNAQVDADVAVSAANLEFTTDRQSVALAPRSSDGVGLNVKARGLLWRGDPVHHDFAVTVAPNGQPAKTLEGTFRQLPLLPGRTFIGAIIAACAIGLAALVGLGVLAWNGLTGIAESAAINEAQTETPTDTPVLEPVTVVTELDSPSDPDPVDGIELAIAVDAEEAPEDALVAVAVSWPDELALAGDTCLGWADSASGDLRDSDAPGLVRPGDRCLIDPAAFRAQADLAFTAPPEGFTGTITARPRELVSLDDGRITEVDPGIRPSDTAQLEIATEPPPFWMAVEAYRPDPESSTRLFVLAVHRTVDASTEDAEFSFRISAPGFADPPNLYGASLQYGAPACILVPEADVCVVDFPADVAPFDQGSGRWVGGALETQYIFMSLQVPTDGSASGLVSFEPVGLTQGDRTLGEVEVAELVPPVSGPVVLGAEVFPVDAQFDPPAAAPGAEVQATVRLTPAIFDDRTAAEDGSRLIRVHFDWPADLDPTADPIGCASYDGRERVCTLDATATGEIAPIQLTFTVAEDAWFDGTFDAHLWSKASVVTYPPQDERDLAGGAAVPGGWPIRWEATEVQPLEFE
ncbi:COG1470 family protein [Agromyces sp. ZXT2-6]|uniref:COG1470 family protein n=1 Tax=Agromyces sp. ZXT2-6 TaxID=3461153 RepID=UPI0040551018